MRLKKEAVLRFESNDDGLPKILRNYRARYRTISQGSRSRAQTGMRTWTKPRMAVRLTPQESVEQDRAGR